MKTRDLKERTKVFALSVIQFVKKLPHNRVAEVLGKQLLRSGTAVGANYRSACRAKSRADFIAKMGLVEEEADESAFWIELLVDAKVVDKEKVSDLLAEAHELTAIAVSSIKTATERSDHQSAFRTPHSPFKGGVSQVDKGARL